MQPFGMLISPLALFFLLGYLLPDETYGVNNVESEIRLFQTIANFAMKTKQKTNKQDLSKIPGVPWIDYPLYHEAPETSFSCQYMPAVPGMYANVETGCQVYHVCHDARDGDQGATFLCTNGTVFSQKDFACDWWYNVDCNEAPRYYNLNLNPETNPYVPPAQKEKLRRQKLRIVVV